MRIPINIKALSDCRLDMVRMIQDDGERLGKLYATAFDRGARVAVDHCLDAMLTFVDEGFSIDTPEDQEFVKKEIIRRLRGDVEWKDGIE